MVGGTECGATGTASAGVAGYTIGTGGTGAAGAGYTIGPGGGGAGYTADSAGAGVGYVSGTPGGTANTVGVGTTSAAKIANIVMESVMAGILKRKAVALEVAAAKEIEALGIQPVGSNEGESGTHAGESAAQASLPEQAAGATASREPSTQEEGSAQEEERALRQKRRRAETPLRSATSAIHPSERVAAASRGKAPEIEAISSDWTPSQLDVPADPLEAVPVNILPPAPRQRWVEEITVSNRLVMVDEELKRLRSSGGAPSQGPSYADLQKELKKAQDLLEAERKKTAD
ncbi:glycine, alanine and asparagine-rich protein-like [Zingiber officinale]|uniref:glycine, alanine and asparagine-rich protein-like n=1 Tax=Zingiber officinale TaxID=94328 RepID=UPI001C4A862F|nr:glycine, alanine and asparagine-rich protein-like [Zingiber officinale]